MKIRVAFAVLLLLSLVPMSACANGLPSELEGSWRATGDLGDGHGWYKEMTLTDGRYEMEGYPPLTASGTIEKVEKTAEHTWSIELVDYVFHGAEPTEETLEITLAEDGESLELNGDTWHKVEKD